MARENKQDVRRPAEGKGELIAEPGSSGTGLLARPIVELDMTESVSLAATNSRRRPARRRWPAVVIGAVALLFFWQYFVLDVTLYGGDTAFVFLPFRQFVRERLLRGELPLWNPFLFGGTPALAEAQYQVFYPLNVLLLPLGTARGMGWTLPLHLAWLASGMYLFGRRSLGLLRPAALFTALAFAFGGCLQSRLAVSVYPQAAAWMPWVLLGYDEARKRGGLFWVLPGIFLATQLTTGAPQNTYYTLALLLAYHLYRVLELRMAPGAGGTPARAWGALAATLGVGALLSAVQVLPELELALQSDRGTRSSFEFATEFSLVGRHFLASMLIPKFWGSFSAMPLDNFYPGEEQGYLGVVSLGLIGAGVAAGRCRGQAIFWSVIAAVSVFLALGRNNPLYHALYDFVPGFAMFRAPARWLLVTSFAGAVLAGQGMHAFLLGSPRAARAAAATLIGLAVVGFILLAGPWGAPAFATPSALYGPWGQVVLLVVAALVFGGIAWGRPPLTERLTRFAPGVLLGLLVLDLFALSLDLEQQHTLFVEKVNETPASVKQLASDPLHERFWPGHDQVPMEAWQMSGAASGVSPIEFRDRSASVVRALMPSCIPSQFGTYGLTGAWGALMPLRRHARPIYKAETSRDIQLRWLRLLNVRTHLALRPLADPEFQPVSAEPVFMYRDPKTFPRAFFVGSARPVQGDEAVEILSSPGFDPRREVLLEGDHPASATASAPFTPAEIREQLPERLSVSVDAPADGYLVVMDTFYPGWRATVDGRPVEIRPANWMGRAVPVARGSHQVELRFQPASVRVGLFVTLAALAGCLAVGVAVRAGRPPRLPTERLKEEPGDGGSGEHDSDGDQPGDGKGLGAHE